MFTNHYACDMENKNSHSLILKGQFATSTHLLLTAISMKGRKTFKIPNPPPSPDSETLPSIQAWGPRTRRILTEGPLKAPFLVDTLKSGQYIYYILDSEAAINIFGKLPVNDTTCFCCCAYVFNFFYY